MPVLHPVTGHVVARDRAHAVVTPPYDALTPAERSAVAATDPDSYLGALPTGGPALDLEGALRGCRDHLARLLATRRFRRLPGPALAVLALGAGRSRAVAVVGDVEVAAYRDGRVLPHERVDDQRVAQLTRYLEVVGVASSPVAVTQHPHPDVTAATAPVLASVPDVAYRATDGGGATTDVALWVVTDTAQREALAAAVAAAGTAFLADGHHRAEAAARYAERLGAGVEDPAGRVLTAVLPTDHLGVRPFHRRLEGLGHLDVATVRARLRDRGLRVDQLPGPARPDRAGVWTVAVGGVWLRVAPSPEAGRCDDPVEALDIRAAERELLPALVGDAARVEVVPVPDPHGLAALEAPGAIGVALHPPAIETVLRIASAGRTVPPKTTYVVPKLRSGLLVIPRGDHAPSPSDPAP